ncbi:MAG: HYR domain-containing protein [Saprospiraceae bacterium]|nr:HYR domain-containing protein [Saprospiraceae bacterium]
MKNRFINHPIPKQLIQVSVFTLVWMFGFKFCNDLKACPEDWPSTYGVDNLSDQAIEFAQLSCKGQVQISVDQNGEAIISPKMLLTDNHVNYGVFKVFVGQTGQNKVYCSNIGKTITATVIDTTTGMSCWTTLIVEDKLPPTIICRADTISCANNPFEVNYSQFVFSTDNCQTHAMLLADMQLEQFNCLYPRYSMVMHLKWIATDQSGNSSSCIQDIYFKKASVDSIQFPPNDTVYCPNPDLTSTGVPTLFGDTVSHLCNLAASHVDDSIIVCGGMIKITRRWLVVDWCTRAMRSHPQEILVSDTTKPDIVCPRDTVLFTRYNTCTASYLLPAAQVTDVCSGNAGILTAIRVDSSYVVVPGSMLTLSVGLHTLNYIAIDPCGNSDTCTSTIMVRDRISPSLICPPGLVVSLDPRGKIAVTAEFIAARGLVHDNCCIDTIQIRRMTAACGRPQDTLYSDEVYFCCEDVGDTLMLVLKATDCSGNMNFCMIEIYVQDKNPVAPPICPNDLELSCSQDYTDLDLTGRYYVISACLDSIESSYLDDVEIDSCKNGQVIRKFYITYPDGSVDSSCVQLLTILNYYRFDVADIIWARDTILPACAGRSPLDLNSFPTIPEDTCASVYFNFTDLSIEFDPDSCEILKRVWTAYSACTGETARDTQRILLVSLAHSKLTGPRDTTIGNGSGVCSRFINLQSASLSGCDVFATITNSFNSGGANASGNYPVGTTKVIFTAEDSCGIIYDTTTVIVVDLENPAVVCRILFLNMNINDSIKLTARGLLDDYHDNCTASDELLIAFSSSNFNDTCRYITCADLQTIPDTFFFTVFVKDSAGNIGSCIARVHVFDPNNHCTTAVRIGDVNGIIKSTAGLPMSGVQVYLDGLGQERMTDDLGNYHFNRIITNKPYRLQATHNKDWTYGLSTQDIVLLQRHILGVEEFNNPYQWIAADVDKNGRLTTADITWIRKLILGKIDNVPVNESWRFIDEAYKFVNVLNPLADQIDKGILLDGFWQDSLINLRAIKVGDISNEVSNFDEGMEDRLRKVGLNMMNKKYSKGDLIQLELQTDKSLNASGIQFHLQIDPKYLELYQLQLFIDGKENRNLTEDEYNFEDGKLKVSLISNEDVFHWNSGEPVIRFVLRASRSGIISDAIRPGNELRNEIFQDGDVPTPILFSFIEGVDEIPRISEWFADPNPFNELCRMRFHSSSRGQANFYVFELSGKILIQKIIQVHKGMNEILIESNELPGEGSFIYYFKSGDAVEQGNLIKMP